MSNKVSSASPPRPTAWACTTRAAAAVIVVTFAVPQPGERLTFTAVDVRAALPRQTGGRSLADFLAWVEREDGRKIVFDNPAIERSAATTVVYGTIDGLTVEEALEVVLPSCGLTHRAGRAVIRILAADDRRGVRL
jgi:hypothetical protein